MGEVDEGRERSGKFKDKVLTYENLTEINKNLKYKRTQSSLNSELSDRPGSS